MGLVRVLAWDGWWHDDPRQYSPGRRLYNHLLREQRSETIELEWREYIGGGEFAAKLDTDVDVVIGDREVLFPFAREGLLRDVEPSASGDSTIVGQLPPWLRPWCIHRENSLVAVPLRWGVTAYLVRRTFLKQLEAGSSPRALDLISRAESLLLWVPSGYFLPTMGLLATAVNPLNPFTLEDNELLQFEKLLLRDLAKRQVDQTSTLADCARKILAQSPDVIVCGGDWVLASLADDMMKSTVPGAHEAVQEQYAYVFAADAKPFLFFEMAGILTSTRDYNSSRAVVQAMASREFRACAERLDMAAGGYVSNPTWENAQVAAPEAFGASVVPAEAVMSCATSRLIPRDRLLRPKMQAWRELFHAFLQEAHSA